MVLKKKRYGGNCMTDRSTNLFSDYNDIVSVKDIMQMIGVGRAKVLKLLQDGKIKSVKMGLKYIVPKQSFIDYLASKEIA